LKRAAPLHRRAVFQALFVTFLWSTSWVLIKIGLIDIPALTFAGLRYMLAFLFLLPLTLRSAQRTIIANLSARQWGLLAVLGILFYSIVQGAQFIGLTYLPAATVSLILNFTSLVVALMGMVWLSERPGRIGWMGIMLSVLGGIVFFCPIDFPSAQAAAVLVVVIGMIANAGSGVLGRYINRYENIPPLLVTTISMGVGGSILLLAGGVIQGIPVLGLKHWGIILWLAVVNTAFAFTLWNHTLRTLPAMESSIINGTMLIQIALLAWLFLGENLTSQEWIGVILAGLGVLLVQLRPTNSDLEQTG
jgi:drug/metabolite transporter (DMT)-like permease